MLDLGCGSGELARHLAAAGLRVTGCDISANMLARRRRRPGGRGRLGPARAGWQTLPFAPATFDAVVAASVLEYVTDPGAVLQECARVLRPGGVLLCTVPDPAHPVRWLEWLARLACRIPGMRGLASDWSRADRYLTYLRISKQRHSAGWWQTAAAQAGLLTVKGPSDAAPPSPLRLYTFQRPPR